MNAIMRVVLAVLPTLFSAVVSVHVNEVCEGAAELRPTEPCSYNTEGTNITGTCLNGVCRCVPGYALYPGGCRKNSFTPSRPCPVDTICGSNGVCQPDGKCKCQDGYYVSGTEHNMLCYGFIFKPRFVCGEGSTCGDDDNGNCYRGLCHCDATGHDFMVLNEKRRPTCARTSIYRHECLTDGEICAVNGICRVQITASCHCDPGFVAVNNSVCKASSVLLHRFSEQACNGRTDTSCQNGICRSKNGDSVYHCLCKTGYVKDTKEGAVKRCVPQAPQSILEISGSVSYHDRSVFLVVGAVAVSCFTRS